MVYLVRNKGRSFNHYLSIFYNGVKMENGFQDERSYARFLVSLPLKFIRKFSCLEEKGMARNISPNGIGMVTKEDLRPHMRLELWLEMPDKGEPLYTQGEVVWTRRVRSNEYKVGIELESIDLMAISRILRVGHPTQV